MRNNDITVSVVIPSYNMGWSIGRAIRSCQKQSYPAHEIIVVNDASTDDTQRIVDQEAAQDRRIRQIVLTSNRGCAIAMITGVANATGQWIAFLDADDELTPTSIRDRLSVLEARTNIEPGLIYGHLYVNRVSEGSMVRFRELHGYCYPYLCKELSLCAQIVLMIRKDCFFIAGFPSPEFPSSTDDDMVLTVAKHFPIACVSKPVAIVHGHDSPTRITNDPLRVAKGVFMLVRKYQKDIVLYHGKRYIALWWLRVARAYLLAEIRRLTEHHRGTPGLLDRGTSYFPSGALELCLGFLVRVYRGILERIYRALDASLRRHFDYIYF
jgi:glycosyltransferase involved in cell wall biosynthesis